MSVDKFKFVSPGVFVKEIDKSEIPSGADAIGPVIIGRTEKGPAFRPTMVQNMDEFIQIFGEPMPGGRGGDVWRNGNYSAPTYAGYAARAYLQNNGPVTVVRVLGVQSDDAAATSQAEGASGWKVPAITNDGAGAYGLFLVNSGSDPGDNPVTGTLAAVWYSTGARLTLSGTANGDSSDAATASNCTLLQSVEDKTREYKLVVDPDGAASGIGAAGETVVHTFNFDPNSDKFIRKVFNTNPIKTNSALNDANDQEGYWLGETFEKAVANKITTTTTHAILFGLKAGADQLGDFEAIEARAAETGFFISQDLTKTGAGGGYLAENQPELFKLVGLSIEGEHLQRKVKVSISNIRAPQDRDNDPFGTFTLEIRDINDTDARKNVLERYDNLNLNPNSPRFISAVIGDRYIEYDSAEKRYKEKGDYPNNSRLVRVVVSSAVANGTVDEEALPFGVKGPLKYNTFEISQTGSQAFTGVSAVTADSVPNPPGGTDGNVDVGSGIGYDAAFEFPSIALRGASNSPEGFGNPKDAYFGVDLFKDGSSTRVDESVLDLVRTKPGEIDSFVKGTYTDHQYVFTLDDIDADCPTSDDNATVRHRSYTSGSHALGTSLSHLSGGYEAVLDAGINKFTTVMHGGFDGLDITEADPFRNTILDGTDAGYGSTAATNYAKASIQRALDVIKDPEEMDFNIAVLPGITNEALTQDLADICEDRGDALAIIDPKGGYEPLHEGQPSNYPALGSVSNTVSNMKARALNTSYACTYYPWVQTRDPNAGQLLWVPPSVVALGTMGSSEANSELWFAPAGFNRGGLSEGSAGISVVSAREKLTSEQRDDLYENRINPIASFPSEGLVIFGQKTTQIKSSALDRINVRRLMIFLKKEISNIANGILFDQNVQTTWNRFKGRAEPLLASVLARFGLEDYKLILDETTTTPDLRDRNIMYAKVLLKPAKAIEFIALDFTIMRSGAAFDD
jgi:hypothetical protein